MVVGMGGGGNGRMFSARSEQDAEAHAAEIASRPTRTRRTRRQAVVALVLLAGIFAGWGVVELLAG